ncbi:MAG: Gfo/Idh/MocA family protein [Cypionkella sp.]
MDGTFKVGLVGCGRHMFEFLMQALKFTPEARVVAVCDPVQAQIDRISAHYRVGNSYGDIGSMLAAEKLDAVIIAAGHEVNAPLIRAALQAGVNVFVEKTPCNSAAEAISLGELQEKTGLALMVGFNRRFMTSYVMAREVSQRPEFGPIRNYHSQFNATPYRSDRFLKVNHIIHHLDLARFLLGEITLSHVDRVELDSKRLAYNISFTSGSGIGVIQCTSTLDERFPMERLELVGDRRNIIVDNVKSFTYNRPPLTPKEAYAPFTTDDHGDTLIWNPSHGYYPRYSHHGYENELRYFFECLRDGKKPEPSIQDSAKTLALTESIDALCA